MDEHDMNDALRDMDCSDDFSKFFWGNPPVDRDVYIREIWKHKLHCVDFRGSTIYGLFWDADMYHCDFSDADLSNLNTRDYIIYYKCKINKNTIPPLINGQPAPAFANVLYELNSERQFRHILSEIIPYEMTQEIFQYWANDRVTGSNA